MSKYGFLTTVRIMQLLTELYFFAQTSHESFFLNESLQLRNGKSWCWKRVMVARLVGLKRVITLYLAFYPKRDVSGLWRVDSQLNRKKSPLFLFRASFKWGKFPLLNDLPGPWNPSRSTGRTQRCCARHQEHQNRTDVAQISPRNVKIVCMYLVF